MSGNSERLEPIGETAAREYRIVGESVEARDLDKNSAKRTSWWKLTPAQLSNHVKRNTEVARWLEKRLGWRRLLWACIGEDSWWRFSETTHHPA